MQARSYYFLLFVVALGIISGLIFKALPTSYGLDIKGGVRLTYRMELTKADRDRGETEESAFNSARDKIVNVMTRRASGMAAEPVVAAKGVDQIIVELPGIKDIDKAKAQIGSSARIEFYWAKTVDTEKATYRDYNEAGNGKDADNPEVSFRRKSDGKEITPGMPEYAAMIEGWDLILAGEELASAQADPLGDTFQPVMNFSTAGAQKMGLWSETHKGKREKIACVLDGRVLSIAAVEEGAVLRENARITGTFTPAYVRNLVNLLNAGSLPVNLKEEASQVVDPTIGASAYDKMIVAGVASFVIISLYLIAYYLFPGFVALIALCLYTLFTLTALKAVGATFSLAAIAGFILSVGMAVDANILVFERFKEEMKAGRSLQTALELGFKRALPAIVDSNACTILTSIVLAGVGTGPVKGFATTLIIGVAISLFTAVTVTRSLLIFLVGSGIGANPKWYALETNWFKKLEQKEMHIVDRPKKWFIISALTVVVGIPFAFMGGFKFNVEFTGGTEMVYAIPSSSTLTPSTVASNLEKAGFKGSNVKLGTAQSNEKIVYVTIPPSEKVRSMSTNAEKGSFIAQAGGLEGATLKELSDIGPTVQREVQEGAVKGVVFSVGLIVIYLALRFGFSVGGFKQGLRFGLSAVGALIHDILVVVFLAAAVGYFQGWEISALFLTAMLTIIGFSVHDTIVIFDRIRENLAHPAAGENLGHLMNESVRQSFARSLNTSLTVIATLFILIFAGTTAPDLKFFMLTMLIGILSGTYSSIFNAAPILYLWDRAIMKKKGEGEGLVAHALKQLNQNQVVATRVEQATVTSQSGTQRQYGQVRRRANQQVKDSWKEID